MNPPANAHEPRDAALRGLEVSIGSHTFVALPQRALYWPARRMLMIADLHIGKSDTFRASGIAVPHQVQLADLERLHSVLQALRPASLVVLGDFIHGRFIGDATLAAWRTLREAHPATRFVLTRGNHDRHLPAIELLLDDIVPQWRLDDVSLSHEPFPGHSVAATGGIARLHIHGHVHPVFRAKAWGRSLPAMVLEHGQLALPAFSEFTAGIQMHTPRSRVWVFGSAEDMVMEIA